MTWAGPVEFSGVEVINTAGRFLVLPGLISAVTTAAVFPRFGPRQRIWKTIGTFAVSMIVTGTFWGFLMVTIEGGIFDQTFWD